MADKYLLRVTAGTSYDLSSHTQVSVNSAQPVQITSDLVEAELNVRVHEYRGLPRDAPKTSVYFEREPHRGNGDRYSIGVRFRLKDPHRGLGKGVEGEGVGGIAGDGDVEEKVGDTEKDAGGQGTQERTDVGKGEGSQNGDNEDKMTASSSETKETAAAAAPPGIPATDLQFGNDFDHPIRDRLPPGFGTAMNIVKWWIDPGLEGDPYADNPYLYGPALSSFNVVHVGEGEHDEDKGGLWFDEGGDEAGSAWRREIGAPDDAKQRMKWALKAQSKERWAWEYGRWYGVDFFNPYIDFNEFALRLPGFNLPIIRYWDGQGLRHHRKRSHQLRYVLRNRSTGQVYLVVLFTLHLAEDVNEDGTLKPAALEALAQASGGKEAKGGQLLEPEPELELEPDEEDFGEEQALGEARKKLSGVDLSKDAGTNDDDVD